MPVWSNWWPAFVKYLPWSRSGPTVQELRQQWQSLQKLPDPAQAALAEHFSQACRLAQTVQIPPDTGILRQTRLRLHEPWLRGPILRLDTYLEHAFSNPLFRPADAPSPLLRERFQAFRLGIQALCQEYQDLQATLADAAALLREFLQAGLHSPRQIRLVFLSPPLAAALLAQRRQHSALQEIIKASLTQCLQTRLTSSQDWLDLLKPHLTPADWESLHATVLHLQQISAKPKDIPTLQIRHQQLSPSLHELNRLSLDKLTTPAPAPEIDTPRQPDT